MQIWLSCFSEFPLDSGKIDFPIQIATLSILFFKVLQVDFPNKCVLQSLNIAFIIANSADPDEMQKTPKLSFQGFTVYKRFIAHYQTSSIE